MASLISGTVSRCVGRGLRRHLLRSQNQPSVIAQRMSFVRAPTAIRAVVDVGLPVRRSFSSAPPPPPSQPPTFSPPDSLTIETAEGVQNATLLYLEYGLGRRRLDTVATGAGDDDFVGRWQRMMEAFLGTQVHVLAGLGYEASERGIAAYNQHLAALMSVSPPDAQEALRVRGRDAWRKTLRLAFALNDDDDGSKDELSIVDARNMMHKVSQRMQSPEVLERIAKMVEGDDDDPVRDTNRRHTAVQRVLVEDVYLGGETSLVEECGFGPGEKGYVRLQCAMAEHQNDPLVAQYVGGGMAKVMQAAGIDLSRLAQEQQQ